MKKEPLVIFVFSFLFVIMGCNPMGCNPFAPKRGNGTNSASTISDLKTVDGVFQNMQYAYTFKDTLIYGEFIAQDFIFTYRDYDQGFDVSWGREDEMRATNGLFQNSQRIDLIWNNIVLSTIDSTNANVIRGFNLTITYNPTGIDRADGRVNLTLRRNSDTGKWQIVRWIDESNF